MRLLSDSIGRKAVVAVTGLFMVLFVIVHLFMVFASGAWNNIRSMITGRYAIEPEEATHGK